MSEDEKIEKKFIAILFVGSLLLLTAVLLGCIIYSPKIITPSFSYASTENGVVYEKSEDDSDFPIEINTATSEELQLIPGIGPSTAKLIIEYREEYGNIVSFTELLSINGIGEKTIAVLEEYCIIN